MFGNKPIKQQTNMLMKNKYIVKIAVVAFTFLTGFANAQDTPFLQFGGKPAQDTASAKKMSPWAYLTTTPWVIQVGPDIVDDNDTRLKEFKVFDERNFYPFHFSAEKRIKNGFGVQGVISTENLNPHDFWSLDLNAKYNFLTKSINEKKVFDPYALIGGGHTYRDFPNPMRKMEGKDNSGNFNAGLGVNIWIFKNTAIYLQSVAKFVLLQKKFEGSNYIQFSAGLAFKIGYDKPVPPVEVLPPYHKDQEAEDAAKYLREILNK